MTRFHSVPRLRLIALLIVALFSISAIAVASSSLVEPASAAKKKKKCKKGYKKNKKGKCKKVVKKKTSAIVSSVSVEITDTGAYNVDFKGTVTTKTPQTSLPVKVTVKFAKSITETVTATGDGTSNTMNFVGQTRNPATIGRNRDKTLKLTIEAVADGISSGVKKR